MGEKNESAWMKEVQAYLQELARNMDVHWVYRNSADGEHYLPTTVARHIDTMPPLLPDGLQVRPAEWALGFEPVGAAPVAEPEPVLPKRAIRLRGAVA